jgi:hypothetical protein
LPKTGHFYFALTKQKKLLDNPSKQEYKESEEWLTKSGGLALLVLSRKV